MIMRMKLMEKTLLAVLISVIILSGNCKSSDTSTLDWTQVLLISAQYVDNNNGTITDINTGKTFTKCAWGQVWSSVFNNCTGTGGGSVYGAKSEQYCDTLTVDAHLYSACAGADALNPIAGSGPAVNACAAFSVSGIGGWRLPTKEELTTLTTAMDRNTLLFMFPQTPDDKYFWSSTSVQASDDETGVTAWSIGFSAAGYGNQAKITKTGVLYVRCIKP